MSCFWQKSSPLGLQGVDTRLSREKSDGFDSRKGRLKLQLSEIEILYATEVVLGSVMTLFYGVIA